MASRTPPARAAALDAIQQCLQRNVDLQAAVDACIRGGDLTQRDAALATELAYGVVRRLRSLRCIVDHFLKNPAGAPPKLRLILETAVYELLHLDRVPAYATVDWAVERAREEFGKTLSGVVNAVLRKIANLGEEATTPRFFDERSNSRLSYLSNRFSCPEWIVSLWEDAYGAEKTEALLHAQLEPPPLGVRINKSADEASLLLDELSAGHTTLGSVDFGLALLDADLQTVLQLEREGKLTRQSLAAQEALLALECDDWQQPVWDACAGRGGKTCMLLERGLKDVFASDKHLGRLKGLKSELVRLGRPTIPVFVSSADMPPPFRQRPATILLDAPCSGLGTLSRRPDIKYKRTPSDVQTLSRLQMRMLHAAREALPKSGEIVYLTCTLTPDENENMLRSFLEEFPDMKAIIRFQTDERAAWREFFWGVRLAKT